MIYITADIHGDYEKYKALLEEIDFSDEDTLYVLGDVVDRGDAPMKILLDMMLRPNVVPILGNHEFMAAYSLKLLSQEITDESIDALDVGAMQGIQNWFDNGGMSTLQDFYRLSKAERQAVLDYLGEFALYAELTVDGTAYVLVHAGLENFSPHRPLEDYEPEELIWCRPDYGRPYYPDKYVVTGHTPTQTIPGNPEPGRIFRANGHIAIDCGCGFGELLGCLCLDTDDEVYI